MPASPIDKVITETLAGLKSYGLSDERAQEATKELVETALMRVLGNDGTRKMVFRGGARRSAKAKPKPSKAGKSARGPKPGGRQLKAHVGKKAFDALDDEVKDKARTAIRNVGDKWKTMTMDERQKILTPLLKKRGVTVDLGKLGGKVEGE